MSSLTKFKDKVAYLIFGTFLIITLFGAFTHSPWRDEAQSWLIVRDLSFSEVISQMPYEGTPPLWHLLLFPLAKLGLPYASEFVIHYLIAAATIFFLIFYSPLPRWLKFTAPFSYYFLFEYSVIARNYNLSALLLFSIAALYEKRWQKPILYSSLIFLLSWSNIHSLIPAAILGGLFIFELAKKIIKQEERFALKTKYIIGVCLAILGPIGAVLMLIPYPDQVSGYAFYGWPAITHALSIALLPQLVEITTPNHYLFLIISLLWIPLIVLLNKKRQALLFFSLASAWLFFIFITKHFGDLRHYGLILIFFLFAWWLSLTIKTTALKNQKMKRSAELLIVAIFIIQALYGAGFYYQNLHKDFSGAKEIANYLKANNLDKKQIAAYPSYSGSALLPYLPNQKFYQFETGRQTTFLTWDINFYSGQASSYLSLKNRMKLNYQQQGINLTETLFLTTLPPGSDPDLELITKNTRPTVKADEFFYLYRWLR